MVHYNCKSYPSPTALPTICLSFSKFHLDLHHSSGGKSQGENLGGGTLCKFMEFPLNCSARGKGNVCYPVEQSVPPPESMGSPRALGRQWVFTGDQAICMEVLGICTGCGGPCLSSSSQTMCLQRNGTIMASATGGCLWNIKGGSIVWEGLLAPELTDRSL